MTAGRDERMQHARAFCLNIVGGFALATILLALPRATDSQEAVRLAASIRYSSLLARGFGDALALSADGKTLVVGASLESMVGESGAQPFFSSGAAHVFGRMGDSWVRQAHFIAPSVGDEDSFGNAIALSADGALLAVAAMGDDSAASGVDGNADDNSVESTGAVYLFRRDSPEQWTQIAYLKAADPAEKDYFGSAVDLDASGQIVAVGAWGQDGRAVDAGAVFVFRSDSEGRWTQQAVLKAPNPRRGDAFGYALALSADGRVLTVGAPQTQVSNRADASTGVAYVFSSTAAGQWELSGELRAAEANVGDAFGVEVAIDAGGGLIAVAAQRQSIDEPRDAVYLFGRGPDAGWSTITQFSAPTGREGGFGTSLDFDAKGETLIVGAPHDGATAPDAGGAYVYHAGPEDRWTESVLIPPQYPRSDWFGHVSLVSADGNLFVVSAPNETVTVTSAEGRAEEWEAAGVVYIFDEQPGQSPLR